MQKLRHFIGYHKNLAKLIYKILCHRVTNSE